MEVVLTTGAISRAKLQSHCRHQQTNIHLFYRPDALPVAQPTVSKHWREKYHIPWTCPKLTWVVFQLCFWPLIAPGYLGGGLPCLSSALWCQYPVSWIHSLMQNLLRGFFSPHVRAYCLHGIDSRERCTLRYCWRYRVMWLTDRPPTTAAMRWLYCVLLHY